MPHDGPVHIDLHVSRFDWAGGDDRIGPGVKELAQRAEAIGVRTLSFMDHFFQMDWMAPAEDPMLEGSTEFAAVGVHTPVLGATGSDPAGELEETFGPAVDDLRAVGA